jgi:hypothetical protein
MLKGMCPGCHRELNIGPVKLSITPDNDWNLLGGRVILSKPCQNCGRIIIAMMDALTKFNSDTDRAEFKRIWKRAIADADLQESEAVPWEEAP